MRRLRFLTLFGLIIQVAPAVAQDERISFVRDSLVKFEKSFYKCDTQQMTRHQALDSFIALTFNKVVIGNDELIKNGTAINLSVSDKTKLSGNYLFKVRDQLGVSLGLNAAVSSGEAVLINNKGYFQSGWGVSAKLSWMPSQNAGRFWPDDCRKFSLTRQQFIALELLKYEKITNIGCSELQQEIANSKKDIDTALAYMKLLKVPGDNPKFDLKKLEEKRDSLLKIQKEYDRIKNYSKLEMLTEVFEKKIVDFEKSAPWSGYWLNWFDWDMSLSTSGKTLIYSSGLVNTDKISENEIFWQYKFGLSYNLATYSKKRASYLNILLGVRNAYALEGKSPVDTFNYGDIKVVNQAKNSTVYDISMLKDYKDQKLVFSPSILYNIFFGTKKVFGLEGFWENIFRHNLEGVEDGRKIATNARFGVILNFSEQHKSGLPTIGVFVKADEYNYKDTFKDYLSLGLRVGVPFDRIFNKKS